MVLAISPLMTLQVTKGRLDTCSRALRDMNENYFVLVANHQLSVCTNPARI